MKKFPILYYVTDKSRPLSLAVTKAFTGDDPNAIASILQKEVMAFKNGKFNLSFVSKTFLIDAAKNMEKINQFSIPVTRELFFLKDGTAYMVQVLKEGSVFDLAATIITFNSDGPRALCSIIEGKVTWPNDFGPDGTIYKAREYTQFFAELPISLLLFKLYSELKTKTLPPKKKFKAHHCRYFNETPFPIDLCDLNWYTQSCQNHPFVVRGHWRMQAHGQGMKQRKLIWIDEFTKHGYKKGAYKEDTK